jgi:hypothetical protein
VFSYFSCFPIFPLQPFFFLSEHLRRLGDVHVLVQCTQVMFYAGVMDKFLMIE